MIKNELKLCIPMIFILEIIIVLKSIIFPFKFTKLKCTLNKNKFKLTSSFIY